MYRWVDHTSELELELEAATEHEVLADALSALAELLDEGEPIARSKAALAPLERRVLHAAARDRPALLAAWLEELLFLSESEGFIPVGIEDLSISANRLRATVLGRLGDPRPLVKAVTYHRLQFDRADRGYGANVVFDV